MKYKKEVSGKKNFPYGAVSNKPVIRVKPGVNMSVNKNVLRSLSNPTHIQFFWSKSARALMIGTAHSESDYGIGVSNYCYSRRGNMNLRSSVFLNAIMAITQWERNMAYALEGEYVPELNMVAFRIDDAVKMEI